MNKRLYSNGKLLLTGEYVVLDGAKALAIPTKYGQSLETGLSEKEGIHWKSFDHQGKVWFEENFDLDEFQPKNPENKYSKTLAKILVEAKNLNPNFLLGKNGITVETKVDFPLNWGLGTSSTLINNIAQWAKVDAISLLGKSFGGSGYDIAAAQHNSPIVYQLRNNKPRIQETMLPWDFKSSLFFVHLNQKQDSKLGIARYRNSGVSKKTIQQISEISEHLPRVQNLSEFEDLLNLHEKLISEKIDLQTIKTERFQDYQRTIKSLGAWGGDFILATGRKLEMDYFKKKGYETIIPYDAMSL